MCKVSIGLSGPIVASPSNFIISWNPCVHDAQSGNVLVTGPQNTFKYLNYKREEKGEVLTIEHSQINYLEEGRQISSNFTAHDWGQANGYILVCTDNGEMMICENSGEYKAYVLGSPLGNNIECIKATENGFLIALEN